MSARHRHCQTNNLETENERLRRELAHKEQQIHKLAEEVAEQRKQIADAEKQIADLKRQLALRQQNSTNSSKPPSFRWTGRGTARAGPAEEEPAESGRPTRPPRGAPSRGAHHEGR